MGLRALPLLLIAAICLAEERPTFLEKCKSISPEVGQLWAEYYELGREHPITNPDEQLQAGDILIFPFDTNSKEPVEYQLALEGGSHAALTYLGQHQGEMNLLRLESGQRPDFLWREFQGPQSYIVLRPTRTPRGYDQQINHFASRLQELGYAYDALMRPDYLDPKKLQKIEDICNSNASSGEKLPAFSCAELVATTQKLADTAVPDGITARELFEIGLKEVRNQPPEVQRQEVDRVARSIVEMFATGALRKYENSKNRQIRMSKFSIHVRDYIRSVKVEDNDGPPTQEIMRYLRREKEFLSDYIKKNPTAAKPHQKTILEKLEGYLSSPEGVPDKALLEHLSQTADRTKEDLEFFKGKSTAAIQELKEFAIGEAMLRQALLAKLSGQEPSLFSMMQELSNLKRDFEVKIDGKKETLSIVVDPSKHENVKGANVVALTPTERAGMALLLGSGQADKLLDRRIIRPVDFLKNREEFGYEIAGIYLGDKPAMCRPSGGPRQSNPSNSQEQHSSRD